MTLQSNSDMFEQGIDFHSKSQLEVFKIYIVNQSHCKLSLLSFEVVPWSRCNNIMNNNAAQLSFNCLEMFQQHNFHYNHHYIVYSFFQI